MSVPTLKSRLNICFVLTLLPALPLAGRLVYLQTVQHEALSDFASREFNRKIPEAGPRGRILDRSGEVLAESLPSWYCSVLKSEAKTPEKIMKALAPVLGMPVKELTGKWQRGKNFICLRKDLDPETAQKVSNLKLPSVSLSMTQTRSYPGKDIARDLLGVVGTDGHGLSGLEQLYERLLSRNMRYREVIKDGAGRIIYRQGERKEKYPPDIRLTLDKNIQFFCQQAIREAVESNRADMGMVLVQEPASGNLLALAAWPQNLHKTPPIQWVYEPGSTFKLITLAAALDKKTIDLSDKIDCEKGAWALLPKVIIHDHTPEGVLSISGVMERSSNIGAAKIALKTGLENFYFYARAFGFGTKTGLNFPGESAGLMRSIKYWKQVDLAVAGYGHGIGATSLQILNAYSAVANRGIMMETRLVDRITDRSGKVLSYRKPMKIRRVISENTADAVRNMLEKTVESGTGTQARIRSYRVAGKTGTSRKLTADGKYTDTQHIASFCGFAPAGNPQFTVLVVLDNPRVKHYGGETAAPAFAEIAKRILVLKGTPADRPEESLTVLAVTPTKNLASESATFKNPLEKNNENFSTGKAGL
ncbi:MAG: penicillin-binding protein 2 [bacterium]